MYNEYEEKKEITLSNNLKSERKLDENNPVGLLKIAEYALANLTKLMFVLKHNIFSEEEAAMYLRLEDPNGKGKQTIRYYALRARILSYSKIGRDGLIFLKIDLDDFVKNQRVQSVDSF